MQATVLVFDAMTASGNVVTDAGLVLPFDANAFRAGGLRLLRPGQRVRVTMAPQGGIAALTVSTLPDPLSSDPLSSDPLSPES